MGAKAEQLRKKRIQAAAAKVPEPLPPAHYPVKRAALGKRQVPGGGG
jgi:hypothetical protein